MSGFGLWSVLHPRIERYLDDPSRTVEIRSPGVRVVPLESAPITYASAPDESDFPAGSGTQGLTSQSRAA